MPGYANPPQSSAASSVRAGGRGSGAVGPTSSNSDSSNSLNQTRRGLDPSSSSPRRDLPASVSHTSNPSPSVNLPASASELRTEHSSSSRQPQEQFQYPRGEQSDRRLHTSPYPRSPRPANSPHRPYQHHLPPSSAPQDQLERLAAEASSVAGGISGVTLKTEPLPHTQPYPSSYRSSPERPVSDDSIQSTGPTRDRDRVQQQQQSLLPIPESASATVSAIPSPSPYMASTTSTSANMPKVIPRTSSIDSAISTVSAQSSIGHSHTSSMSSNTIFSNITGSSASDVQSLIQAAGSAEELVRYMLKDKNSMAAQNSQLWRLVDKQRAMILGLNKDLERALKDKDRYRKKLKEHMNMIPPLPTGGTSATTTPGPNRAMSESPAPSLAESRDGRGTASPIENGHNTMPLPDRYQSGSSSTLDVSSYPITPSPAPTPINSRLPLPVDLRQMNGSDSENDGSSLSPRAELSEEPSAPRREESQPQTHPRHPMQQPARINQIKKLGISTAVPAASGLGKSPLRKAPPAPLDFSPQRDTKAAFRRHAEEEDEDEDENESAKRTGPNRSGTAQSGTLSVGSGNSWQATPDDKKGSIPIIGGITESPRSIVPQRPAPIPEIARIVPPTPNPNEAKIPDIGPASPRIRQQFARGPLPSPGLPSSPRPIDRPLNSPKPRNPTLMGLPGSPRAPLQSIPPYTPGTPRQSMPPPSAHSAIFPSPNAPFAGNYHERSGSLGSLATSSHQKSVSDGQTILLIQPSAIPSIDARIVSSRMRPSRMSMLPGKSKGGEDSVFTLGVFSRSDSKEILRVEKDANSMNALDAKLRKWISYSVKVPDRVIFSGHAPARVDARRTAIDEYFAGVLGATMDERAALALCEFFSVDVVDRSPGNLEPISAKQSPKDTDQPHQIKPIKEGYLTKKGKNFGGWKERYFVLDGPILKYFDGPGGAHLGQIKLQQAQIGRQSASQKNKEEAVDEESQYRHAFLVLEPKRKDSSNLVRHVLCAESDAERDGWVNALLEYVDKGDQEEAIKKRRLKAREASEDVKATQEPALRTLSYEETNPGPAPARGPTPEEMGRQQISPSPSSMLSQPASQQYASNSPVPERNPKQISGPSGGSVISDLAAWGASKLTNQPTEKALKKRSIWGFRQRSSSDLSGQAQASGQQQAAEKFPLPRAVFGASLDEAVYLSRPPGMEVALPAVVYRCIEYLDAKNASEEEGIFRLSGSNVVIKGLKEKFNSESDFNLLANDEYYDVHAIAGLLKLYLRELPTNILTTERREDFVKITEMGDKSRKIAALNELVHMLPIENFSLLKALSGHLLRIVDNADINKMTIRNVGIVFSPTLNIPAQVFSMFLYEFREIFFRKDTPQSPTPSKGTFDSLSSSRPSVSSQRGTEPPGTPTLIPLNPAPARAQPQMAPAYNVLPSQLPDTQNIVPQVASTAGYEPVYQKVISPGRSSVPRYDDGGSSSGGLSVPDDGKSAKSRRRESSMMFMMGGMGKKNGMFSPTKSTGSSAMVMEDSVYE
ncbi:hypothetical protein EDC01DRAFT_615008 [Geopyxis carbonaria]|nr:hypothetical protein EDC01DRAFT_615008 [Geopyxis carbonaria]